MNADNTRTTVPPPPPPPHHEDPYRSIPPSDTIASEDSYSGELSSSLSSSWQWFHKRSCSLPHMVDVEGKLKKKKPRRMANRNGCLRCLCCACCLPAWATGILWFVIIAIVIIVIVLGAIFSKFVMPTMNMIGVTSSPYNVSQISFTGNSLDINFGLLINVQNPNMLQIDLSNIRATAYLPSQDGSPRVAVGSGYLAYQALPKYSNQNFTFPFAIQYAPDNDRDQVVLSTIADKCGLTGEPKQDLTIQYTITVDATVLFITVHPQIDSTQTFTCPLDYRSTRGQAKDYSFEDAVMAGLSPDGGLFIPHSIPSLPTNWRKEWANYSFQDLSVAILSLFIDPTEIPTEDLRRLVEKSYSTFRHDLVTPLAKVKDGFYVMELFHGPTFAFKDVALQFVGNLFEYFLDRRNRAETTGKVHRLTVVGATSGDTGSAAIYGLRNKKNVSVFILHPRGRVSPIQEAQMTTVLDKNVHNLAVEGTFDDCQDIVKNLFSNTTFNNRHHLGAVNSINWARILAQTVYYFQAYFTLLRSLNIDPASDAASAIELNFSVPTGNFGDILAGFFAHKMGLPTHKLIVATNENDILYRFFETQAYEKQQSADGAVKATLSPAMDILVSSNFERLLWYLARDELQGDEDRAGQTVAAWMDELKTKGSFRVSNEVVLNARKIFDAAMVSDEQTLETIRAFYQPSAAGQVPYVLDPHTSVGVTAAERIQQRDQLQAYPAGKTVMISLATAHPAKFSEAVETALQSVEGFNFQKDVLPTEFIGLLEKERSVVSVERADPQLVMDVIEKELRAEGISF
ncbi:threonine synthase [Apophysomyces ossiformis]|uniref:threonine synthase n=1 Tax=Apophysomyces ossiformis TaxID=679940 RepID=A0A8H7ENC2_9FUNG|nr:threonine synthase [Apophysomyces ossiformis]